MNKYLLGTTALAAASLAAAPASAAEPIMLGITGYYSAGVSFTDQDMDDTQEFAVRQDGEIHFGGSTVLDNGLEVGVQVELEAFTTDDQIDEHYVWFEGTFGQLRIGADDHVAEQMHSFVPTATPGGTDTPTYFLFYDGFLFTPNTAGTGLSSDENKLIYFTPRFNGFQLGLSYAPNGGDDAASGGEGGQYGTKLDEDGDYEESFSLAVNFVQAFNDVGLDIGASYQLETFNGGADDDVFGGHAYVTFGGFTVGGSGKYVDIGDSVGGDDEAYSYGGGVLYETGPWAFSAGVTHTAYDDDDGTDDYDLTLVDVGGSYTLGPGVALFAFVQYVDEEYEDEDYENEGIAGMVGTSLSF